MFTPLKSYADFEAFLGRFTNYERVQFARYDKQTFGVERMRAFAADLGNPQRASKVLHIAGTKGKGSTTLLVEALLEAEGEQTGAYLSPHVEHLIERIRIGGAPVSPDDLIQEVNGFLPVLQRRLEQGPSEFPSFFELMTALAFSLFRRRRVSWSILEVGLGGRLDATNIAEPRVCAITNIGLEHTAQLGNTLAQIAREKAGIIKPRVPVVLGPLADEARDEILRIASDRGAPVVEVPSGLVQVAGAQRLRVAGLEETFEAGAVRGASGRANLALALVVRSQALEGRSDRVPRPDALSRSLARVELPARMERFETIPPVLLDGAHTVEAVRALAELLEESGPPRPRAVVFSIAEGKQLDAILRELLPLGDAFFWTRADPLRSVPPDRVREIAGTGTVVEAPEEALARAFALGIPVIVTGSFYLAGRLRGRLRETRQTGTAAAVPGGGRPGEAR